MRRSRPAGGRSQIRAESQGVDKATGWCLVVLGLVVCVMWLGSLPGALHDGVFTYAGTETVGNMAVFHLVIGGLMAVIATASGVGLIRGYRHAPGLALVATGMVRLLGGELAGVAAAQQARRHRGRRGDVGGIGACGPAPAPSSRRPGGVEPSRRRAVELVSALAPVCFSARELAPTFAAGRSARHDTTSRPDGAGRRHILGAMMDVFDTLYPQLQDIDFRESATRLDVPVYLVQGAHEAASRAVLADEWFQMLQAPHKELLVLDTSGHRPISNSPTSSTP